ncbi:MAG: hypothetical protein AAB480_03600 [Patescibacteria group bacterium]
MAKSMDDFLAMANRILKTPEPLPDSLPKLYPPDIKAAMLMEADGLGPLEAGVKESIDDSVPRRRALGAKVLRILYGPVDFGEIVEHMAGSAVDALRAGNQTKCDLGVAQVFMAIEKRRGAAKKPESNPEEQLKDPARRAAGDAARENVAWAAGQLRYVAGTDFEEKKAREKGGETAN